MGTARAALPAGLDRSGEGDAPGPSVWIVVPAHGRLDVSRVAFEGIAWCLRELRADGTNAHAIVVADDANLGEADAHDFWPLERPNKPLGRKWNDGYEFACKTGATHVMPCGSDDWVHPNLVRAMLAASKPDRIVACRQSSAVRPDGRELAEIRVPYEGGDGIRMLPRALLETVGFRPTHDMRDRAIDGAMRDKLRPQWTYVDLGPWQIVDFKTPANLTSYASLHNAYGTATADPWESLAAHYPPVLIERAKELYT